MTTNSILTEQLLREVLDRRAAPARADGLLAEIAQAAALTPQRRTALPRVRWLPGSRQALALAPILMIVAVLGALVVMPRFLGPAGSPTPAASPTPELLTIRAGGLESQTLPAGRYYTGGFAPRLIVTVPDRLWAPVVDAERQLLLRARLPGVSLAENDSMTLVTIATVYENACTDGAASAVPWPSGSEPGALLDWLETEMSFDLGPRSTRTILGRPALEVEFTAPDLSHCNGGFLAITDAGPVNPFGSNPAGQPARYAAFELNGRTVLVGVWTTDPARRDVVWAAADAVLESLEIAP